MSLVTNKTTQVKLKDVVKKRLKSVGVSKDHFVENSNNRTLHYGEIFTSKNWKGKCFTGIDTSKADLLLQGDIVFSDVSNVFENLGRSLLIKEDESNLTAGTHTIALRLDSRKISSQFLHFLTETSFWKEKIRLKSSGNMVLGISPERLLSIAIPLPPLETQLKIVEILDAHEELVKLQEERVRLLKLEKEVITSKIFDQDNPCVFSIGDKTFDTSKWERKSLSQLGKFSRGSDLTKADLNENGRYEAVIAGEFFRLVKLQPAIKHKSDGRERIYLSTGKEIFFPGDDVTKDGLLTAFGVIKKPGVLVQANVFFPSDELLLAEFGAYSLRNNKKYIRRLIKGNTVHHIYSKDLAKINVYVPDLFEQKIITDFLDNKDILLSLEEEKLRLLKLQKEVVLHEIFSQLENEG